MMTAAELAEAQQRFELYETLFAHPGWKLFISDVEDWKLKISERWRSITPEALRYEQGRYHGLEQVTTFENLQDQLKAGMSEPELLDA